MWALEAVSTQASSMILLAVLHVAFGADAWGPAALAMFSCELPAQCPCYALIQLQAEQSRAAKS